jgi:DnaJ-class molecular chaperone
MGDVATTDEDGDMTEMAMDNDQAASVLGAASNAYFEVDCEACGGAGILQSLDGREYRRCPTCDGTGIYPMPSPAEIEEAAGRVVRFIERTQSSTEVPQEDLRSSVQ